MGKPKGKGKGPAGGILTGWALIRSIEGAGFIDKHVSEGDREGMPRLADLGIGSYKFRFELEVHLDDGRPAYVVADEFKVPREVPNGLCAGLKLPVRADASDPSRLDIDWAAFMAPGGEGERMLWNAAQAPGRVHEAFSDQARAMMVDGWVRAVQAGFMTRSAFDEAISGAVSGGLLTATEADAARLLLG